MIRFALFAVLLAFPAFAQTTPPNPTRWARGEIALQDAETENLTPVETWDLTTHPDGSRTLRATSTAAGPAKQTVHLRVEKSFRPRELFAEYWADGTFRNSTFIAARNFLLDVTTRFTDTTAHELVKVTEAFSFNPLTLASSVWHAWYYNRERGGTQPIMVYEMDVTRGEPMLTGNIRTQSVTYVGFDLVSVPAGTYPSDHYRIDDTIDYYVTGPDAMFVKLVMTKTNTTYVLSKVETGGE